MTTDELITRATVLAIILLVSFPIHEFSHALAAYRLGDSTARYQGRLTLNPIAHFDPMGGLLLAFSIMIGSGFGWAKPTPVNPRNLQGGQWGEAIVSAAGPISNLVIAIAAAIPLRVLLASDIRADFVVNVLFLFIRINLLLMVFNLIPIPPLDGSGVLFAFLPPQTAWQLRPILAQYGILLIILLIFPIFGGTSVLGLVVQSIVDPLALALAGV